MPVELKLFSGFVDNLCCQFFLILEHKLPGAQPLEHELLDLLLDQKHLFSAELIVLEDHPIAQVEVQERNKGGPLEVPLELLDELDLSFLVLVLAVVFAGVLDVSRVVRDTLVQLDGLGPNHKAQRRVELTLTAILRPIALHQQIVEIDTQSQRFH